MLQLSECRVAPLLVQVLGVFIYTDSSDFDVSSALTSQLVLSSTHGFITTAVPSPQVQSAMVEHAVEMGATQALLPLPLPHLAFHALHLFLVQDPKTRVTQLTTIAVQPLKSQLSSTQERAQPGLLSDTQQP